MYLLRITLKSIQKIKPLPKKIYLNKKKKFIKINTIFNIKQKKKIFTVLRSPHINKKSREQFLYRNSIKKLEFYYKNSFLLFNHLIFIKKKLSEKFLTQIKIIKI